MRVKSLNGLLLILLAISITLPLLVSAVIAKPVGPNPEQFWPSGTIWGTKLRLENGAVGDDAWFGAKTGAESKAPAPSYPLGTDYMRPVFVGSEYLMLVKSEVTAPQSYSWYVNLDRGGIAPTAGTVTVVFENADTLFVPQDYSVVLDNSANGIFVNFRKDNGKQITGLPKYATLYVDNAVNVSISPSSKTGDAYENLTYTVTIYNTGKYDDNYTPSASDTMGRPISFSVSVLSIAAGDNASVTMTVNAGAGTDTVTVHADGKYAADDASCTAIGTLVSVTITPAAENGWTGDNLIENVTVTNFENNTDNFLISLSEALGWTYGWNAPITAAANHVVISEFTTRGSPVAPGTGAFNEFVELYNPTNSPILIENWIFEYWSSTAWVYYSYSTWVAMGKAPIGATIPAHGFYLFADIRGQELNSNTGYDNNPPADVPRTDCGGISDGAAGAARGLRIKDNNTGTVIDTVVYEGNGNTDNIQAEGGRTAPNRGTANDNKSVSRKILWVDTDNNARDFIRINQRTPENSSFTLTPNNSQVLVTLDNGASVTYQIWVVVGGTPCTTDNLKVTATSWSDNTISDNATCRVRSAVAGVSVVSITPSDNYGWTGDNLSYNVKVQNNGELPDNFTLENIQTRGWTIGGLPATIGPIAVGDNWNGTIWAVVAGSPGDIDNITVKATSVGDPSISDNKTCYAHHATAGVDVTINPPSKGGIGDTTFTVTVKNTGDLPDNYTLENSDNLGWALSLDNVVLGPIPVGENRTTTLHVDIPNVLPGTTDTITVKATSKYDNTVSDNAACQAAPLPPTPPVVPPAVGVSVSVSPSEGSALPGNSLSYTVTVMNTGGATDTFDLGISGEAGWSPSISPNSLTLAAGTPGGVTLTVTVPSWTAAGASTTITVTATSRADPSVSASVSCMATASELPAGLEVTPTPTGATLPATLAIAAAIVIIILLLGFILL